jgi:hypothetical protein
MGYVRWFRGSDGSMDFEDVAPEAVPDGASPEALGSGGSLCRCGHPRDADKPLCALCTGMDDPEVEAGVYFVSRGEEP